MQKCQDCQNVLEKNEPKKLDQINKNTTLRSHSEMDKNIFIIMFFYKGTPLQSNLGGFESNDWSVFLKFYNSSLTIVWVGMRKLVENNSPNAKGRKLTENYFVEK